MSSLCGIAIDSTPPFLLHQWGLSLYHPLLPIALHNHPATALAAADSANLARRLELREILFNASYRQAHFRRQTFTRYFRKLLEKFQNLYHTFYHTFSHTLFHRNQYIPLQPQLDRITPTVSQGSDPWLTLGQLFG